MFKNIFVTSRKLICSEMFDYRTAQKSFVTTRVSQTN